MSLIRTMLAVVLAALMGAPLCCCAYETMAETAKPQPSCCHASRSESNDSQRPQEHICACRSKDPRESAKELKIPGNDGVEFTPPTLVPVEWVALEPVEVFAVTYVHTGSDPPTRLRLARLSRWLN